MTPVGHALLGAAIGVAVAPRRSSKTTTTAIAVVCALLANAPDWPLPHWGHDRYDISHSVIVALGLIGLLVLLLLALKRWRRTPDWLTRWVLLGMASAWLSHFILDSLYNHQQGVAIFWPISDARLALPLPWFETYHHTPLLSWPTWRIGLIETASYLPFVILALLWRFRANETTEDAVES